MASICDYLRWRSDISFAERPFNDVDNLILSVLAYLDFSGIVPKEESGESIALSDACEQLLTRAGDDFSSYVCALINIDREFVELIAASERFGPARLQAYVDTIDKARELQFSALQIVLSNKQTFVAYRGTDSSIVGWREDFMLLFQVTEAQREATYYLRRAIAAAPDDMRFLVGGHSKGGNLAAFAASNCSEEDRLRIDKIYCNDGPGMASEAAPCNVKDLLGERLVRIVPVYSVIGMLFESDAPQRIVKSSNESSMQHDLTSWQVGPTGLDCTDALDPACVYMHKLGNLWLEETSLDDREHLVSQVFDALEVGGATTLLEISSSASQSQQVLAALAATDERTKAIAFLLLSSTAASTAQAIKEAAEKWGAQLVSAGRSMAQSGRRRLLEAGEGLLLALSLNNANDEARDESEASE